MGAHLLDHFVFSSRRLKQQTKMIVFGVITFLIVANFWWFRGVAFGIDGPVNEHWGLHWRKVRKLSMNGFAQMLTMYRRAGIYMNYNIGWTVPIVGWNNYIVVYMRGVII